VRVGFLLAGVAGIATRNALVAALVIAAMLAAAFVIERVERRKR
jgi:hypothetical protein